MLAFIQAVTSWHPVDWSELVYEGRRQQLRLDDERAETREKRCRALANREFEKLQSIPEFSAEWAAQWKRYRQFDLKSRNAWAARERVWKAQEALWAEREKAEPAA